MGLKIILNETVIEAVHFHKEMVNDKQVKRELWKIKFDFRVTSDSYHDITTLLYKNDFAVDVPKENLKFSATIHNYSTSITNLYKANEVGDFHLELIEKM